MSTKADKVDLEELFSRFGKLVDVSIKGGHNQPFAFIEFEDASSAEQAMEILQGEEVHGRQLRIEFTEPFGGERRRDDRSWNDRSLNRRFDSRGGRYKQISATAEKEEEVLTQTALDQETEVISIEEIEKEGDLTTDPTEEKTLVKKTRTTRETAAEAEIVKETQSTKTG